LAGKPAQRFSPARNFLDPQEQGVNVIHSEDKDVQRIATVVLGPSRGLCELSIPMSKPLRVEIRELVVNHLQTKLATGEQIDVAEMTYEIAQSLVDVIMEQEEEGQSALFAFALTSLGEEYLQRRGALDTNPKGH
jgi:hypothetical protein